MKLKKRNQLRKINKIKNWFYKMTNKIDRTLTRIPKKKERRNKLLIPEMK